MNDQKTVWVTGASSGLGLHTAMALRDDGWQVIAGARSFTGEQRDGMTCLPLDVTDWGKHPGILPPVGGNGPAGRPGAVRRNAGAGFL